MFAPPRNGSRRFSPPAPFRGNAPAGTGKEFRALRSATKGRCPLETRSLERLANFFESAAAPPVRQAKAQLFIFQKSFKVFSVVCFATSSGETPLTSAIFSIMWTIIPLSQRLPRLGSGAM